MKNDWHIDHHCCGLFDEMDMPTLTIHAIQINNVKKQCGIFCGLLLHFLFLPSIRLTLSLTMQHIHKKDVLNYSQRASYLKKLKCRFTETIISFSILWWLKHWITDASYFDNITTRFTMPVINISTKRDCYFCNENPNRILLI